MNPIKSLRYIIEHNGCGGLPCGECYYLRHPKHCVYSRTYDGDRLLNYNDKVEIIASDLQKEYENLHSLIVEE